MRSLVDSALSCKAEAPGFYHDGPGTPPSAMQYEYICQDAGVYYPAQEDAQQEDIYEEKYCKKMKYVPAQCRSSDI